MAEIRQLSKSPLREAIIDFRVAPREGLTADSLEAARELVESDYPTTERQWLVEGQIQLSDENALPPPEAKRRLHGLFFRSEDGTLVVQFRLDGFTFNQLQPYTDWETVFPEAIRLWKIYLDITRATHVTRLATRYINAIKCDLPLDPPAFFTAPPRLPPNIPNELAGFIVRTTTTDSKTGIWVQLTQVLEEIIAGKHVTIVMDIDVFKPVESLKSDEEDTINASFAQLREMKNRVFFESITERLAKELE